MPKTLQEKKKLKGLYIDKKQMEKFKELKYEVKVNISPWIAYRCGCTTKEPHSHLVAGFTCECEKGQLNLSL